MYLIGADPGTRVEAVGLVEDLGEAFKQVQLWLERGHKVGYIHDESKSVYYSIRRETSIDPL